MHSSKIREKNQERGRHGIQETVDPTQEGSVGKSQAESCTSGLKRTTPDWSRRMESSRRDVFWGENELQATGSMIERLDKLEDMLKAHHSFVNKKKKGN